MIKNCRTCGKPFFYVSKSDCPECIEKDEELLLTVLSYIKNNPDKDIKTVSTETGAKEKKIMKWLKDGRIIAVRGTKLKCGRCKKPINSGMLCEDCLRRLNEEITDSLQNSKKSFFYSKDKD